MNPLPPEPVPPRPVLDGPDPEPRAAPTDTTAPAGWGLQDNGDFVARLAGRDFRLAAADIARAEWDLRDRPQPVPGLEFRTARFDSRQRRVIIDAGLTVPRLAEGALTLEIDGAGRPRLRGTVQRAFDLPALGRSTLTLGLDPEGAVTGTADIPAANLAPPGIRGLTATGSGVIHLAEGRLSGAGTVRIAYADLGQGTVNFGFDQQGGFTGTGTVTITPPFLDPVTADLAADAQGNITAHAVVPLAGQRSPVPKLTLTGGAMAVDYRNGTPGLTLTDFAADYAGFGRVDLASLTLDGGLKPSGAGRFAARVPMLATAEGAVSVRAGRVAGRVTIGRDAFPEGLPIRSGTITADLAEDGSLGFAGGVAADFGPAGRADVAAGWGADGFAISGTADLTIPGLNPVHLTAQYRNGALEGSVDVPVDNGLIPGLSGNVTVRFSEGRWSGETALAYSADGGKLRGTVTVTIAQNDRGGIDLGGTGAVTAQLMPGLEGTLTATILPEGGIDVSGEIRVTDPYQLFPEQRLERELFSYSQNIPLWGILVAVIRVRAGVRAGIGPGVFRDIRVTGSYTLGSDAADPSFAVSGELYMPAFVEGYVAFGAGLGLDVLLGSLTGGIEGVATAGIYGAVSVVPELSYADGAWSIDGTATLAAGARLKLGLNAWAEVEALWVTVWEQTWALAEVVMPVGPDLALQARMHYTFGRPEAPTLDFSSSDIDSAGLIAGAMPKDGPPSSGARAALENKAEWKGALQEQRAAPLPPGMAEQAAQAPDPPAAPAKPPASAPPGGQAAADAVAGAGPGGGGSAPDAAIREAATPDPQAATKVPESAIPDPDAPRYPTGITLKMLEEPPVPEARTAAQEVQDVDAAKQVVDLASAQASDTDALDNYFPQIRNRFRLTSIGYEGDFDTGFDIAIDINPKRTVRPKELVIGAGLPDKMPHKTEIRNLNPASLGGVTVGTGMKATPLGPDHPAGSAAGGQDALMNRLQMDPGMDAQSKFVRGHLLNQELGGAGSEENLFPITAHANAIHLSSIEADVKRWVNEKRMWVAYNVEITNISAPVLDRSKAQNHVNATIVAEAHGLMTDLTPAPLYTRRISIQSTFRQPAVAEVLAQSGSEAAFVAQTARPEDAALSVNTGKDGPVMGTEMVQGLTAALIAAGQARSKIDAALLAMPDIGPERVRVLWEAYDACRTDPDRSFADKPPAWKAALTTLKRMWPDIVVKLGA